jgi:hypothetical protein
VSRGASATPGPWFGPNFNSATAEPTRALVGKFKKRGHKSLSDYDLRVEVSGDNVVADARLIAAAPELYEALVGYVDHIEPKLTIAIEAGYDNLPHAKLMEAAKAALAKARGEQ